MDTIALAEKAPRRSPHATVQRTAFSIMEFCERNGISRTLAYAEIRNGRLKTRKVGRRQLITVQDEAAWHAALLA